MSKADLFVELANPDNNGISRWVNVTEFVGKFESLIMGNGGDWNRGNSSLRKKYIVETDKSITSGNSIDAIRLNGFNMIKLFNQSIHPSIRKHYSDAKCVIMGIRGNSENTKIEIDHKDGRKDNERVSNTSTQSIDDFQPLTKAANDAKRQICIKCAKTNQRWDARNILGNPYSFYDGDENYTDTLRCVGCFWYDPVEYRKTSIKKVAIEATTTAVDIVLGKLYPENGGIN